MFRIFWSYFQEVQPPLVRRLHLIVLLMVLVQMLSSNLIGFGDASRVSEALPFFLGTWVHFIIGIALAFVGFFFAFFEIARRGARYFFPYLWGDGARIKADLKTLFHRRLPEATPGSLATVVQGLGLGALVLPLAFGLGWFVLWRADLPMAETALALHQGLTGLVQAYVVGHGGLGLVHIFLTNRAKRRGGQRAG